MDIRLKWPLIGIGVAVSIAFALASSSCGVLAPDDDTIVLTNGGDLPVVALLVELETSHRFDPNPRFEVGEEDERIIVPSASRTVEDEQVVGGYRRGDDVRVFMYEVHEGEAVLEKLRTFSHPELVERDFEIELP